MLQRIERHFRNEQAIRRRAEEAEAAAAEELAHERDQRLRMEEELRTRTAEAQHTDALKANLQAEYLAVESPGRGCGDGCEGRQGRGAPSELPCCVRLSSLRARPPLSDS